ncbi:hypothetical protein CCP3SC15_2210006 [Gammaproteobacteria bacterium]
MASGELVWNRNSNMGLREVHVMRHGAQPDADEWMDAVCPDYAQELVRRMFNFEKGLGIWHLYLWWNAREVTEFLQRDYFTGAAAEYVEEHLSEITFAPVRYGVMWWIGAGESVSFAADCAATLYFRKFGRMPEMLWMAEPPAGHDQVSVQDVGSNPTMLLTEHTCNRSMARLTIEEGKWVPANQFLVVGIKRERFDPVWKDGRYE